MAVAVAQAYCGEDDVEVRLPVRSDDSARLQRMEPSQLCWYNGTSTVFQLLYVWRDIDVVAGCVHANGEGVRDAGAGGERTDAQTTPAARGRAAHKR